MRISNIRRATLSLIGISVAYAAYAVCVVPFVEPNHGTAEPASTASEDIFSTSTDQYVRELTPLFPEDSWELDHPMVLRSKQATILLRTFEKQADSRLLVKPCTIVFYGSQDEGKNENPTIMQAPQGITLAFDTPIDLSSGTFGKPISGQTEGEIHIVRRGDDTTPGFVLATQDVVISSNQIWTKAKVAFQWGETYGSGQGLLVTRSESQRQPDADSLLDELSVVRMDQLDTLSLRMEENDLFESFSAPALEQPRKLRGLQPTSRVNVRCQGAMTLDLAEMKATLEDQVIVNRSMSGQQPDTVSASKLILDFGKPTSGGPRTSPATKAQKVEIKQLTAVGKPLVVNAPSQQVYLECDQLRYQFANRTLSLNPTNAMGAANVPQKPIRLQGPNYQIQVPSIQFVNHEDRNQWRLRAIGPGEFRGSNDQNRESHIHASWTRSMAMTPDDEQQRLRIEGAARVETPGTGSIQSAFIELAIRQVSEQVATELDGTPVMKTKVVPIGLTTGNSQDGGKTIIESSQLSGTLTKMDIRFRRNPHPAPPRQSSLASTFSLTGNKPKPNRDATRKSTNDSRYRVEGGELTAWVDQETQELHRMIIRGRSKVFEENNTNSRPFQLEGNAIDLQLVQGVPIAALQGTPAKLSTSEIDAIGNTIRLDGTRNEIGIPGAGSLIIQASPDMFQQIGRSAAATADARRVSQTSAQQPVVLQPIELSWTNGLEFDGQIVQVAGRVQAVGEDVSFATGELKLQLDREIDLSQIKSKANVRPQLQFVSARGGVTAAYKIREENGALKGLQQVYAKDLDMDLISGDAVANGPGRLAYTSPGKPLGPLRNGDATVTRDNGETTLNLVSIAFRTQLKGNLKRREAHLKDDVRMWMGDVPDWNKTVNPNKRAVLRKNDVWLSCDELLVMESPSVLSRDNKDPKPIELLARGSAYVEGQLFAATGQQIKYAEDKGMMTFEGDARRPAEVWIRPSSEERGQSNGRFARIRFWPKTSQYEVEGWLDVEISTATADARN